MDFIYSSCFLAIQHIAVTWFKFEEIKSNLTGYASDTKHHNVVTKTAVINPTGLWDAGHIEQDFDTFECHTWPSVKTISNSKEDVRLERLVRLIFKAHWPWQILTKFGESRDWKWNRRPAEEICSSQRRLASWLSLSEPRAWFNTASNCSEKEQTAATRLWLNTISLLSWISESEEREKLSN